MVQPVKRSTLCAQHATLTVLNASIFETHYFVEGEVQKHYNHNHIVHFFIVHHLKLAKHKEISTQSCQREGEHQLNHSFILCLIK